MKLSLKSIWPARDFGWNRVKAVCASDDCHNKLLTRAVPHTRSGIHVGDQWYCSPDCFAQGSRRILDELTNRSMLEMPRQPRLSLGLAMLSKGYLTEPELRMATDHSHRTGQTVESVLVEFGLATDRQIAAARAAQWGYPVLGQECLGHGVQTDLPLAILQSSSAAVLHCSIPAKRLLLGFVDRVDHSLLQSIEQITDRRAELCFITPTEFAQQVNHTSRIRDYEEFVVEDPASVAQMARTLGGYAVEVGAREARFTRSKSWAWARLSGKRGTVDVLFGVRNGLRSAELATDRRACLDLQGAVVLG